MDIALFPQTGKNHDRVIGLRSVNLNKKEKQR
jgi:hypothetical protein